MNDDPEEGASKRRGLGAPGAAALVLLLLFAGLVVWLQVTSRRGEKAPPPPQVVVIPMPAAPAPAQPETAAPPAAPPPPAPTAPEAGKMGEAAPPAPSQPTSPAPAAPAAPAPKAAEPAPVPAKPKTPPQIALAPAPAPDLIEHGKFGPLPRIGANDRLPWKVYARPFDAKDTRPRIALVIGNLGLSGAATEAAIQQLPGGITLAFSPYSRHLEQDIPLARAAGHEVLLSLPMEPVSYPTNDPGPQALLTALTPDQNLERLDWLLARFTGYVGVTNYMGSRFTASNQDMRPILEALHKRGLLFFDSRSGAQSVAGKLSEELGLPTASNERFIDAEASRIAIDKALAAVEEEARQKGVATAMGFPYPVTIERVAAWVQTLPDKGFVLIPVSAAVSQKARTGG